MAWLPVFYFRQVPLISEVKIIEILEVSSLLLFSLPLLDFVTVGSLQMFGRRGSGSEGDGSNVSLKRHYMKMYPFQLSLGHCRGFFAYRHGGACSL